MWLLTGLALPVQPIALLPPLHLLDLLLCLAGFLDLGPVLPCFSSSFVLAWIFTLVLHLLHLFLVLQLVLWRGCEGICMSEEADRIEELSLRVDHLSSLIANLTEAFRAFTVRFTTPSSVGSFEVVEHSEAAGRASHPAPHRADGSYQELEKEIPELPDFCRTLCGSLHGGQFSAEYRANRAWESGWWARFCLQGRLDKPRPSKKCDLANTIYVVLRAEGYVCPLYVHKAGEYRVIVKNFKEDTISHGFASLREAKVYCAAAGVELPSLPYQWRN